MKGLGRVFNVVAAASGVHIPLKQGLAVTYVTYLDAGSQIATLKQSIDGASEAALSVKGYPHKGPGVGGTWTAMADTEASTFDLADDATNDCMVFTVGHEQLDDGYNCVEVTVDGGICVAIIHDLLVQRKPSNLARNVV